MILDTQYFEDQDAAGVDAFSSCTRSRDWEAVLIKPIACIYKTKSFVIESSNVIKSLKN